MKYLIAHISSENNWLSSRVNFYKNVDGYMSLSDNVELTSLAEDPILLEFQNIIAYFVTQGAGAWTIKTIKCTPNGSYNITHEEPFSEEVTYEDENGQTITETINSTRTIIDEVRPILDVKITDKSNTIMNSERSYFEKSTNLSSDIENSVISIWNYFDK